MRKGQTEIIGLVVIVVIVVFIAIFALSFSIKPEQDNEDILKLKANALRSSLIKTNLCGSINVGDEIENCIDGYNECLDCDELKGEITKIMQASLENEKYNLIVVDDSGVPFFETGDCLDKITAVSENLRNGVVEVSLCRR